MPLWQLGDYLFDAESGELRGSTRAVRLPPTASRFLSFLIAHAGRVVSHDELLAAVWPDAVVTSASITSIVKEIRLAVGDTQSRRTLLEAAYGRGYRLLVAPRAIDPIPGGTNARAGRLLIGREKELSFLAKRLQQARQGRRQFVVLRGESGVGKTRLIQAFVDCAEADLSTGKGQCLERYGAGEPFLPLTESLTDLINGRHGADLAQVLSQTAPAWWTRIVNPVGSTTRSISNEDSASNSSRYEILTLVNAFENMSRHRPILLVIEDLQWSDRSTIDFVRVLVTRRTLASVMVVVTHRNDGGEAEDTPTRLLLSDLCLRGLGDELRLGPLSIDEVGLLIAQEYPANDFPPTLAEIVHQRSDGNPLFVLSLLRTLRDEGMVTCRQQRWRMNLEPGEMRPRLSGKLVLLIRKQAAGLNREWRDLLEAAGVAGRAFDAVVMAAMLGCETEHVEDLCNLVAARTGFIRPVGTCSWPDRSKATQYEFVHAAYQEVLYEGIAIGRRRGLHHRAAVRIESGHAGQRRRVSGLLAMHFMRAAEPRKAATYHRRAGAVAMERVAPTEAIYHYRSALNLFDTLPPAAEIDAEKALIWIALGASLIASFGHAAAEVGHAFEQARQLCEGLQPSMSNLQALAGLAVHRLVRGEFAVVCRLSEEIVELGNRIEFPDQQVAYFRLYESQARLYQGEVAAARRLAEPMVASTDANEFFLHIQRHAAMYWVDPRITARVTLAGVRSLEGRPDDAGNLASESIAMARSAARPFELTYTLLASAVSVFLVRRDWKMMRKLAIEALELAEKYEFLIWNSPARILGEPALGPRADLDKMKRALSEYESTGSRTNLTMFLVAMIEVAIRQESYQEAASLLQVAFEKTRKHGERCFEPELYRMRGVVAHATGELELAAADFSSACRMAEVLGMNWWMLRAACEALRLTGDRDRGGLRRRLEHALALQCGGDDTDDLVAARQLLLL